MESNESVAGALAEIARARTAAADRLITPWWYHPILGVLLGAHLVALSLGTTVAQLGSLLALIAGAGVLARVYSRMTGIWVTGFDAGRASRWAYAMVVLFGVCTVVSVVTARTTSLRWPTWCLAATVVAGCVLFGRRFDASLRAQLQGRA